MLRKDPEAYFSEFYSRFPDEGKVFNYSPHVRWLDETLHKDWNKKYEYVIVAYDPALQTDIAACVVLGYNKSINKIVVLEEYKINKFDNTSYINHPWQIEQIRAAAYTSYYSWRSISASDTAFFVMDWTHRSTVDVFTIKWQHPDMRIFYGSNQEVKQSRAIIGEYKVGKSTLVDVTRSVMDSKNVVIGNHLSELNNELDNFYEIDTGTWVSKYEGVSCHDDYVNAMMMWVFFLYEGLQLKYKIITDDWIKIKSDNDILSWILLADGKWGVSVPRNELHSMVDKEKVRDSNNNYFRRFVY